MSDAINPDHYKRLPAEAIEIIEAAIDRAPSNRDALLHGQALKYILRCWEKNGIEDLCKAKWYLDRLVASFDDPLAEINAPILEWESEETDQDDHPDHFQVGDTVVSWQGREGVVEAINLIEDFPITVRHSVREQVSYKLGGVKKKGDDHPGIEEPNRQPTAPTLNSDNIPEGYRKLKDSSIEPRQRGDLRWSIAEKRYIEIGFDEIGYANRENWAACRKITEEVTGEVTGEVKNPIGCPDGWRWLEVGETLRKGDTTNTIEPIPEHWVGTQCVVKHVALRRNKFEVGEKVVSVPEDFEFVIIDKHSRFNDVYFARNKMTGKIHKIQDRFLAPYIEETIPEIAGEGTQEVKPPDGYRWLEVGEVIRKGDLGFENGLRYSIEPIMIGMTLQPHWRPTIRRNRFEVGEKVVHGDCNSLSISVVGSILGDGWLDLIPDGFSTAYDGFTTAYHVKDLAPYIEETN